MAYDPIARTVLLFGGGDVNGQYLGDTWLWDGTGWTQQFPPLSPAGRKFDAQTLAYNVATGTILLFGGTNASGVLNDTWEWDGKTNTWTQRFPASSPSPRNTTLAYDPRRSQVVLFGGSNAKGDCCSSYYNDTWTWDGQNWTQQFPVSSPPTRVHPAMVYDPNIGATIIYGGFHTPGVGLFDTWSWDGSNWTQLQTLTNPGGRWAMGSVFDSLANAPLIFGGEITGDPFSNQTWILTP